ncbi:MAG TPA: BrnT family toxin [Acetobacteraceae bacterium]|nr:BrnT family toxin [Acetobacteraceae bacterium]
MEIALDPAKRAKTLQERALDFADAGEVFSGLTFTATNDRHDYGEIRFITAGYLHGRFVVLVWTERGGARHIISMRSGHEREKRRWRRRSRRRAGAGRGVLRPG